VVEEEEEEAEEGSNRERPVSRTIWEGVVVVVISGNAEGNDCLHTCLVVDVLLMVFFSLIARALLT